MDFDVYGFWKDIKICHKSSMGNFENFSFPDIFTAVFGGTCVPGVILPGNSDLIDRGYHFFVYPA
ncbi:MAG: hypothetical protein IKU20_11375 [Lachnospiraceae bacterium]|nr:hypothetical protein [Lachnospiraceae bacterium]